MTASLPQLIADTADLIAVHNPALAATFRSQPFQRVNAALAFARGFARASDNSDPHPTALAALRVALLDREYRAC